MLDLSFASQATIPSGVRKMFEKASRYDDVINMSIGEPGFVTPEHIIRVGADQLMAGKTKYVSNAGIPQLRSALSKKLWLENGIRNDPDKNLIVTAGATQALMLTMIALVNPGDEVIIPGPSWPDYLGQVQMVNAKPVWAVTKEANDFKMTADVIERLITPKTKLIMLNSPSNPTGAVLTRNEIEQIALLVKKHNLYLISDEPYEHLLYDDARHFSIASLDGLEEHVVSIYSFSKTYAMTGWRIGYACSSERIVSNLVKLHENMVACISEAFQMAAIEALNTGLKDADRMRDTYDQNRRLIVEGLNSIKGFSCSMPKGAFYAFPNVSDFGLSSVEVANKILEETGIITAPGSAFGEGGEGYLRISFASSKRSIEAALERLATKYGAK